MSKALRLLAAAILAVVAQTTLAQYLRVWGVAPDLILVLLVAATDYCGPNGGYCLGAVTSMLYDASVGYVLAINMVSYTLIGLVAPLMRGFMDRLTRKLRHKRYFELAVICFLLTAAREIVYIGYLFIIGSEQSMTTLLRMLLACGYGAAATLPGAYLLGRFMAWTPGIFKKAVTPRGDLKDDAKRRAQP